MAQRSEANFPRLAEDGWFYSQCALANQPMETEQLQDFNERLSQWVASQGFWFQVRYSMSGSGMKGQAMFHLLRMAYRLLIFLLLAALVSWIYLAKRTDTERFNEATEQNLKSALAATDLELKGIGRQQGQFEIGRLAAEGGNETFFTALEARNIRCKMGLLDGVVGIWEPGTIAISRLNLDLRAGADDAESARKLAEALFRRSGKVDVEAIEVADATLRWGYSERTQGAIESSDMKALRTETGWRMTFKGGLFYQNWLRGLEIVNLVVSCDPEGLVFEKAELKRDGGTVDFSGLRVAGGALPRVQGVAKIRSLGLDKILPPAVNNFIEGSISSDFRVFGSTNTSDGVGFEGQVVLDGTDVISLRERLHILGALSVVDYSRNYHRIDFREGSFQMKTIRGGLELTDVDLKAEDLFTVEGRMLVRLPTDEEIMAAVAKGAATDGSPWPGDEESDTGSDAPPKSKSDFSLKRAALEAQRIKEGDAGPDSGSLFDRLGQSIEMRRLQDQESDRLSRMLQYEGMFRITIPHDAFERAPRLAQNYPVNSTTNRIPIDVPIKGNLYELTVKQAEGLYQLGRR